MSNITIQEEYTLPSLGKLYGNPFDPTIRLRSMTVAEEMKRLTVTDQPYKAMAEIIEACLETPIPISVYDLCLGDYQYLLHKLRTVTYGPEYKLNIRCPHCGNIFEHTVNLDELKVFEYSEDVDKLMTLELPSSGKFIEIGFQTPRDLDNIDKKKKEFRKKYPDVTYDPTLMLNLETLIKSIDGERLNPAMATEIIKKLPMRDSNVIIARAEQLNTKVGIDINITSNCPECLNDVNTSFRFTSEFFRPTVD